jgi:hypothetical protein
MKLFACPSCHQVIFFENSLCTRCGHPLAYLADCSTLTALEPLSGTGGLFSVVDRGATGCAATTSITQRAIGRSPRPTPIAFAAPAV